MTNVGRRERDLAEGRSQMCDAPSPPVEVTTKLEILMRQAPPRGILPQAPILSGLYSINNSPAKDEINKIINIIAINKR